MLSPEVNYYRANIQGIYILPSFEYDWNILDYMDLFGEVWGLKMPKLDPKFHELL